MLWQHFPHMKYFAFLLVVILGISPVCGEELKIARVSLTDKVASGHLYFSLSRDENYLYLSLINAHGPNLFASKNSLNISGYSLKNKNGDFRGGRYAGGRSNTIKGPEEFVRLAYEKHEDGSICGWQITPCPPSTYSYNDPSDVITVRASIQIYFGDLQEYLQVNIDHASVISDIPLIKEGDGQDSEKGEAAHP